MEDPKNPEHVFAIFDHNFESALHRVVDAYAKRGFPDEDAYELDHELDILASGHVIRMVQQLMLLRPNDPDLELDIQAADRVTEMFEQLALLRGDQRADPEIDGSSDLITKH